MRKNARRVFLARISESTSPCRICMSCVPWEEDRKIWKTFMKHEKRRNSIYFSFYPLIVVFAVNIMSNERKKSWITRNPYICKQNEHYISYLSLKLEQIFRYDKCWHQNDSIPASNSMEWKFEQFAGKTRW